MAEDKTPTGNQPKESKGSRRRAGYQGLALFKSLPPVDDYTPAESKADAPVASGNAAIDSLVKDDASKALAEKFVAEKRSASAPSSPPAASKVDTGPAVEPVDDLSVLVGRARPSKKMKARADDSEYQPENSAPADSVEQFENPVEQFEDSGRTTGSILHPGLDIPPVVNHTTGAFDASLADALPVVNHTTGPIAGGFVLPVVNRTTGPIQSASENLNSRPSELTSLIPPVVDHTTGTVAEDAAEAGNIGIPPVVRNTTGGIAAETSFNESKESENDVPPVVKDTTGGTLYYGVSDPASALLRPKIPEADTVAHINAADGPLASHIKTPAHIDGLATKTIAEPYRASSSEADSTLDTGSKSYHGGTVQMPPRSTPDTTGPVDSARVESETLNSSIDTTGGEIYYGGPGIADESAGGAKDSRSTNEAIPPVVKDTTGSSVHATQSKKPGLKKTGDIKNVNDQSSGPVISEETTAPPIPRGESIPVVNRTTGGMDSYGSAQTEFSGISSGTEEISFFSDSFKETKNSFQVQTQNGDFLIPHELYQGIVMNLRRVHDRDVFCCLLRWSLGFHRDWCEAGLGYICKWTKIADKSNVSKALKRLTERGYIEIVQEPDYKGNRGTVYRLPLASNYLIKKGKPSQPFVHSKQSQKVQDLSTPPVVGHTTGGKENPGSNQQPTGSAVNYPRVVDQTTNKETPKDIQRNSHSRSSDVIEAYFSSIEAGGQRESERDFFEKLLGDGKTLELLEIACSDLTRNGIKPGEPCRKPMKFLWEHGQATLARAKKTLASREASQRSESHQQAGTEELIPVGDPRRKDFDLWLATVDHDQTISILMKVDEWAKAGLEQVERWTRTHPASVTNQLMQYFLDIESQA